MNDKASDLRNCIHDLSNKLAMLDGKIKKAQELCTEESVKIEIDKANNHSEKALEMLTALKMILSDE
jgi:hypothetical protein